MYVNICIFHDRHTTVGCSVLQCVAATHDDASYATPPVLQCVAVCCSVLQCVAIGCSVLQCVAVSCSELRGVAETHDDASYATPPALQRVVAVCCTAWQRETHDDPLPHRLCCSVLHRVAERDT